MSEVLPDRAWMTPLLNRIADVAGERAALLLGRERACEKVYIPDTVTADHWLVRLVGLEPAIAISAHFGGQKLEIPAAIGGDRRRRAAAIAEMIDKGYSTNEIARSLGVAHTTVKEHRRKRPRDDGQGSLF